MDYYREAPREYKCDSVDRLRGYAVSLMEQGDGSLARQFNSFLRGTGCRKSPIIIDPNAVNSSENPGLSDGGMSWQVLGESGECLSIQEILAIEETGFIYKQCGETFVFVKAHY